MNGATTQNGPHLLNGATSTQHHQATEAKIARIEPSAHHAKQVITQHVEAHTNGILPNGTPMVESPVVANGLEQAPLEVLQLIGREHYLPMSTMISRTAQNCWTKLSFLVDELSHMPVPQQTIDSTKNASGLVNNQSKANLDKKQRILEFANDQKADFVKLLVLLQWSRNGEDVNKTMNLNLWLMKRRWLYLEARDSLAFLKQEAPNFQIPNPDIKTAGEILSHGKALGFPDVGYRIVKPLKGKQIISTLRRLSRAVTLRLALEDALPAELRNYHVHDGRATFVVENEFELDLSVLEESPTAPFRVVDFRFTYSPRPSIPEQKRQEIEFVANSEIDQHGLLGCYDFFHNLTITAKLTEFYHQAISLSRNQWAGYLRAEILRRDLVVEYWRGRDAKKSWIEISVNSGRTADNSAPSPFLAVRWFRDGKEIKDFDLEMDPYNISFESILLQVVAQHINHILDGMYDRLLPTDLFHAAELLIELSTSCFDPKDCMLEIQMTKDTRIDITVDSISGSFMLSPASDRANRLQSDLNRASSRGEDLIPRLMNYRCALAEDTALRSTRDTRWQRLEAFRPAASDVKSLFGHTMARVNFFRHSQWCSRYLLSITNDVGGDRLWIVHQSAQENAASLSKFSVIHEQPIPLEQALTARYFVDFAEYASGVVALHSNAQELQTLSPRYRLPQIPDFEEDYALPSISLDIAGGKVAEDLQKKDPSSKSALAGTIRLSYKTVNDARSTILSVELRCQMDAVVLERLAASNPDPSITFAPKQGLAWLAVPIVLGESAINEVVQRVTRLNDVIACIQTVQNLASMTLISLSMTTMTVAYRLAEDVETQMTVRFPGGPDTPQLEFSTLGSNSLGYLTPYFLQLLTDSRRSFSTNLDNVLSSLTLTYPLVTVLHDLQQSNQPKPDGAGSSYSHPVRIHVLVRQPTMFGLQYFTSTAKGFVEHPEKTMHERLLARFEIIPSMKHPNQWLLRPAIEEVNAYTRNSFASTALKDKVREGIFAKQGPCPDWIRLDFGAIFLKDRPRPVLEALQSLIIEWVKSNPGKVEEIPVAETAPMAKQQPQPKPAPPSNAPLNANGSRKPSGQPPKNQPNAPKPQPSAAANIQRPKNMGNKVPPKKEIITLD